MTEGTHSTRDASGLKEIHCVGSGYVQCELFVEPTGGDVQCTAEYSGSAEDRI